MRSRILKPSFFENEDLAALPPLTRLLFQGLWLLADRRGRLEDRPKRIKSKILPFDDWDVDAALSDLERYGFIVRYRVGYGRYIQVVNFERHQQPHVREPESVIPPPPEELLQRAILRQLCHGELEDEVDGTALPDVRPAPAPETDLEELPSPDELFTDEDLHENGTVPAPDEHGACTVHALDLHGACTVQAPDEHCAGTPLTYSSNSLQKLITMTTTTIGPLQRTRALQRQRSSSSSSEKPPDFEAIVSLWNEMASACDPPLPQVLGTTRRRAQRFGLRCRELARTAVGEQAYDLEFWRRLFERVRASPFLRGEGESGWQVTLDWLLEDTDRLVRVLEGYYEPREPLAREPPAPAARQELPPDLAQELEAIRRSIVGDDDG